MVSILFHLVASSLLAAVSTAPLLDMSSESLATRDDWPTVPILFCSAVPNTTAFIFLMTANGTTYQLSSASIYLLTPSGLATLLRLTKLVMLAVDPAAL